MLRGEKEQVVLTRRGLLRLEHFRMKWAHDTKTGEEPTADVDAQAVEQMPPARL